MSTKALSQSVLTAGTLRRWGIVLFVVWVIAAFGLTFVGQYSLELGPSWQIWRWDIWSSGIWQTRVFRLLAASVVGCSLASAGLALQGLLRNPLAEPYVLGISSGAGVGVLFGSLFTGVLAIPNWLTTPLLAFAGAIITAGAVYGVAQRRGRLDPYVLLLSGVIVNVFNGALILTILQFVRQTEVISFVGWGMGQVPEWLWHRPGLLILCGVLVVGGWLIVFVRGAAMNTLGLGDEVATSSGVSVGRFRIEVFFVAALMTSAAVALAGPIGFVGLIVPHACRMIVGADHRLLAIVSGFSGAIFLMAADTLCRILGEFFQLGELPVGVITAMIGGPVFIVVLRRRFWGGAS